jgi:Glycosyltransferase WbsX
MRTEKRTKIPASRRRTSFIPVLLALLGMMLFVTACDNGGGGGGAGPAASGTTVAHYQASAYDGNGTRAQDVYYTGPGADGEWFTADDTIGSYTISAYDNGNGGKLIQQIKYNGTGSDGTWFNSDDDIEYYASLAYDTSNRLSQKAYYSNAGADDKWFTADDVVSFYEFSSYDTEGNRVLEVRYGGAGADGFWFTADDDVSAYTRFTYTDGNKLLREIKFYWSGDDGLWFTYDDNVRSYKTFTYDAQGALTNAVTYYGPGSDGNWYTPDDNVLFAATSAYDDSGKQISENRYDGSGADAVWLTSDDASGLYTTLTYDDNGNLIKTISYSIADSEHGAHDVSSLSIGVFYFPGWHSTSSYWDDLKGLPGSWSPGIPWPDRVPILGYYPEEETWVAERHIDWASQYGIDFFAYDWFWDGTQPEYDHALKNHLKANNKDKLKFCLLWAPHHVLVPNNLKEFDDMAAYWIDNYFNQSIFYTIDGKPVIFIFSHEHLEQNAALFGQTAKSLLARADSKAREQGYKGIYFIATRNERPSDGLETWLRDQGYSSYTGWNYVASKDGSRVADYDSMVDTYLDFYNSASGTSKQLPYIAPASPGWDDRPWHGDNAYVRTNPTPEKFQKMLYGAKKMMNEQTAAPKVLMIEAWNEFDEGAYMEPVKKWGAQYLEAMQKVFGPAR